MLRNVTFRQLRVFEAVARNLSFSRAAEELHLTQPAVSMQVKGLEDMVGLPLTEQVGRRIYLTAAGEELARQARRLQQQVEEADAALDAIRGVRGGRLTIGVVSTAKYFAPRLLAAFRDRHPGVELRLSEHNRERLIRELEDNAVDLAIMGRPPKELPTVAERFAEHPLILIAAPEHPLAAKRRLALADLAQETFMVRESGSGTRASMERYFGGQGFVPAQTFEMSSNETIKQAVMAGMGVAFLSAHTVQLELAIMRLVQLKADGTPVMREWFVVHRADKRLLPLSVSFKEFLLGKGASLIADRSQWRRE